MDQEVAADQEVDVEPVRPLYDVVVLAYGLPCAPSKDFEILQTSG
jgi:hypothetical protein